jgi:hypothetical protein
LDGLLKFIVTAADFEVDVGEFVLDGVKFLKIDFEGLFEISDCLLNRYILFFFLDSLLGS